MEEKIVSMEEFKEISNRYNLGNIVKEPKLEEGGQANYNYILTTNKGVYQVRVDKDGKRDPKRDLEYAVTDTLDKSNFLYNTPKFLKNSEGERLTSLDGKTFEVYERLPGEVRQGFNEQQYRQLAKTLAKTHKHLKTVNYSQDDVEDNSGINDWLRRGYDEMESMDDDSETTVYVKSKVGVFRQALQAVQEVDLDYQRQVVHGDLTDSNVLFEDENITGIIDFNSISVNSRTKDIADTINRTDFLGKGYSPEKERIFLEEYNKVNPLDQGEADTIIPWTIRGECIYYYHANMKLPKMKEKGYELTKHLVDNTQRLLERLKSKKTS